MNSHSALVPDSIVFSRKYRLKMNDIKILARDFAIAAHAKIGHRRKYTGEPYHIHLLRVAELVAGVQADALTIAAAWLHDVVEDTGATFADIEKKFGKDICRLVRELTDVSRPSDGNRAARKSMDRHHLAKASTSAKTVKLADLIDNTIDISEHDPAFARVYINEAVALLPVLSGGDSRLFDRATATILFYAEKLGIGLAAPTPADKDRQEHITTTSNDHSLMKEQR